MVGGVAGAPRLAWRATAGKRLCRLRIVRADGAPVGLVRAFLREAFVLASFAIPVIGVLNVLVSVNDPGKQSLHDKVADTLVVGPLRLGPEAEGFAVGRGDRSL